MASPTTSPTPTPDRPMVYLVGDPINGPFATLQAQLPTVGDPEIRYSAARAEAERFGDIADEMDWHDEDGGPAVLFIVT
jgi:hypothetical protein